MRKFIILSSILMLVSAILIAGCTTKQEISVPDPSPDVEKYKGSALSYADAKQLAEKGCTEKGTLKGTFNYNENSGNYWFDTDIIENGCNPGCVVSSETKTAELKWYCTGAEPPTTPQLPDAADNQGQAGSGASPPALVQVPPLPPELPGVSDTIRESDSQATYSQSWSRLYAEAFIKKSKTYAFDGGNLVLLGTESIKCSGCFKFTFKFQSSHSGYGDRTGQNLLQVITPHSAVIKTSNGAIDFAFLDETYDFLNEKEAYLDENGSKLIAEKFIQESSTYNFDGSKLEYVETSNARCPSCWMFKYRFKSSNAGYGYRKGKIVAQVITPHDVLILMNNGRITSATIDDYWDMMTDRKIQYAVD